jgi:UDP-N-acetylglucosamine:LPS N-acetylglucosamine transferase
MPHILILTAHSGGGHVSLAEALRERMPTGAAATIADPLPRAVNLHYRLVSRHALWLWEAEFRHSDTPARALATHRALALLLGRRLRHLLDRCRPDLVISTCGVLTYAAQRAIERSARPVPFATLFADAEGLHATWLTARDADATLAPTRESYAEALAAGFSPERLHLVGWPVRAQFLRGDYDRRAVLAGLGLDPARFTVFVQGGGEGTAHIARTVESVLAAGATQVLLAAGTNRLLHERFARADGVRALPFTREIAPLMAASDLALGKAGPNMLFETVTLGRPFVATTFIPGQEAGNLSIIRRHGLGWVALDPAEQRALIAALAAEPAKLAAMAATVDRYRAWNAIAARSIGLRLAELSGAAARARPGAPAAPARSSERLSYGDPWA